MRLGRILLLWLSLAMASGVATAQAANHAGTYRTHDGASPVFVHAADGRLHIVHVGSSRTLTLATFASAKGLTGVLPSGDVVSLGPVFGRPHLLVGMNLLPLTPVSADEFSKALARIERGQADTNGVTGNQGRAASLGGLTLVSFRRSNGYAQMRSYDFCSDGSFFYRFEELQSSQLGNAAGERQDVGSWTVAGDTLHLRFRGKSAVSRTLQRQGEKIGLDGVNYGVERSKRCR